MTFVTVDNSLFMWFSDDPPNYDEELNYAPNAKTWERDRRNRMNTYFKTLADLLPPHQEGRKRNKVDILIHASKYIKELNNRTEELFNAHAGDAQKEELSRMKKLVTQLFSRTQLLSALLRDAGITVPAEPALEKISPLKWSNKINVEDGEKYLGRLSERKKLEKRNGKQIGYKVPSKQKTAGNAEDSQEKVSEDKASPAQGDGPLEDQENHVNSVINESSETREVGGSNKSHSSQSVPDPPHDVDTPSESAGSKPSKGIRKLESRKKVKRKGKLVDAKLKKKNLNVSPAQSQSITNLLPGTLIWSAGKLMPLVTPITPLTSNILVSAQAQSANPIILGNTQQNHQMIVMQPLSNRGQNSVMPLRNQTLTKAVQKVSLNTVPSIQTSVAINSRDWASNVKNIIASTKIGGRKGILPKGKEITSTTMTYKVPIPAIHREPICTKVSESANADTRVKKKTAKSKKQREKNDANQKDTTENSVVMSKEIPVETVATRKDASPEIPKSGEKIVNCKKRKINEDKDISDAEQSKSSKIRKLPETCKSIENLRHVVEKIGDDASQGDAMKEPEEKKDSIERESVEDTSIKIPESTCIASVTSEVDNILPSEECVSLSEKTISPQPAIPSTDSENAVNETLPIQSVIISELSPKAESKNTSTQQNDTSSTTEPSNDSPVLINEENTALSEVAEAIAEAGVVTDKEKDVCDLGTQFDSLLRATEKTEDKVDSNVIIDSAKIILNLDTNTTTTMKPEICSTADDSLNTETSPSAVVTASMSNQVEEVAKVVDRSKDETLKSLTYSSGNTFVPIGNRAEGLHSDLSNDLFASLQVPSSSHNPESISPTAAFLMAFPLVSSLNGKTEVLEEEMKEDLKYHSQTPPMLLQIGAIEPNSFKVKTDNATAAVQSISVDKSIDNSQERAITKNQLVPKVSGQPIVTKALPKIVNNETIKERLYKVVPYPESSANNSANNSFGATSTNARPNINHSNNVTIPTCGVQSTPMIQNSTVQSNVLIPASVAATLSLGSSVKCDTTARKCENTALTSACTKYEATNSATMSLRPIPPGSNNIGEMQKYDSNTRYPDYVPGYANFTSVAENTQTRPSFETAKTMTTNPSQTSATLPMVNESTMSAYSSTRSQAVQSAYVAHTTGKDPQVAQQIYIDRSKDSVANSTESMSYASFPPSSQASFKDSYTSQNYDIHGKDAVAQISFQGYPIASSKNSSTVDLNSTQHDRPYITSRMNETIVTASVNNKETAPPNSFQNYPALPQSKDSATVVQRNSENSSRLTTVENQRVEPTPQPSTSYTSFGTKDPKQNVHVAESMFQGKRNDSQAYVPYSRDPKKPIFDAANSSVAAQVSKTQHIQNSSIPRYPHQLQQQAQRHQTCVASSNYGQSTASDNMMKSTTTVAHNSSNFSILSWTTFSPISGGSNNNNLVQYETAADHVDETEGKTICENYSYAPLYKENVTYGNMLPSEGFPTDSTIVNVNKERGKLVDDNLKQQNFDDPSKTKSVQPIVAQQKSSRAQNQNANPSEDYKFGGDNKNKGSKYPMGSTYTQTEFATLEQQRLQHSSKGHQTIPAKPEKPSYTMPTYDSHTTFELAESNVPIKCNSEMYATSNYKYNDDKDAQLKYLPHSQRQPPVLHHNNSTYNNVPKHGQQQQQQQTQPPPPPPAPLSTQQQIPNKTKTIPQQQLQQQPMRPPVNWMMTPEIKHNTNIADLILPPIGKELEFCQNNLFTQPPSYNQGTPNHQFYNNYEVAVSASHGFPNMPTLQSDPRRIADGFYTEEQPFTWSPTKNTQSIEHNQTIKSMDQYVVVPSTLPTLVGDLALGTNISEKPSFLFGQMPPRTNKDNGQPTVQKDKEANVVGRDYQTMLHTQNVQHSGQGTSFLSVSQLVEHEKAEKSQQHQNHHPHNHQPPQQTQQQPQQTRKHQRKNNASPRATGKRPIETRKQSNVADQQLHPQHPEEQKLPTAHAFPEQSYHQSQQQQSQKYQQNDVHWRNRHCKSNYTAEALIGGNTSVHDTNNSEKQLQPTTIKSFSADYAQNKYPSGLSTTNMVMPPINYLSNSTDDPNGYGQVVNQNFNHSSYAYSPNTNIYPTTNFITSISNTPTSYMMPLHENPSDFLETNSFLLPNVANVTASSKAPINTTSSVSSSSTTRLTTSSSVAPNPKNHQQHYAISAGKHQNCDKRNSYSTPSKKSKRKTDNNASMHNLDFSLSTVGSPREDYHSHPHSHHHHHHGHTSTFLAPSHANPLYQNHPHPSAVGLPTNANRVTRGVTATGNSAALSHHHPSGTSLTNFNLSTIFPEINDKVTGYKPPNVIPPGLPQSSNQTTATYPQRANYTTNNALGHVPQVSESAQFTTDLPAPPPPGVLHYKNT